MKDFPEISALNNIYLQHRVEIEVSRSECLNGKNEYPAVTFKLGGEYFKMYVDDEQDDFRSNYPLLNLCVVLRELEYYNETEDFLLWCTEMFLDPSNSQVLTYYRDLAEIYRGVEAILGKVDSFVSDWDFEMGSGVMHELRK